MEYSAVVNVVLAYIVLLFSDSIEATDITDLHLINILPYPDPELGVGWDPAFELIPAAELAIEQINNDSDFLPGYKLNLINVDSEACGVNIVSGNKGLVNTYAQLLDPRLQHQNVVGLIGLFCSSVTGSLAPVFSSPNIAYLQLAGSTALVHRNSTLYPYLIHLVSSSKVFNEAVLEMMNKFNWTKIGVLYDDSSGIFFQSTAVDFIERAGKLSKNVTGIPIITTPVSLIDVRTVRISYFIGSLSEEVQFLCAAYKNQAVYPGYVYIFAERTVDDFVSEATTTDCTSAEVKKAMEGVFLLQYNLVADDMTELVSNMSYKSYYQEYMRKLTQLESIRNMTLDSNVYANSMYDEVWTFALTLKESLGDIANENINLGQLSLADSKSLADILRRNVPRISFQGASGYMRFDSNETRSVVNIFQVKDGKEKLAGTYRDNLTLMGLTPPNDTFENKVHLLPLWLSISLNVLILLSVTFTSLLLVLILAFRKRQEIKASSFHLSLVIFLGCYLIFMTPLISTITKSQIIANDALFIFLCNVEVWLGPCGLFLIFSTLLMRLLRIHHIFGAYNKVRNKYWKDKYLLIWITAISSGGILILILWTILDRIDKVTNIRYEPNGTPPFFETRSYCNSDYIELWLAAILLYTGILMAITIFLAIQTRKIKLSCYKDTKKVNALIFMTVLTMSLLVPVWILFHDNVNGIIGHAILNLGFLLVGLYCQLFLFLPQVCLTLWDKKGAILRRRETQFYRPPTLRSNISFKS